MVQYCNRAKTCHQPEIDGIILKHTQNQSPVRKRWENTETMQKPVTSQKKMVQYSNRAKPVTNQKMMVQYSNKAKTCHQSEKRWYNTQTGPKPVTSQKNM